MAQMKILVVILLATNATLAVLLYRCNRARLKHLWERCHNKAKLYRILALTLDENSQECQQIEARVQKWCDLAERFKHQLYPNRDRSTL